MHAARIAIAAAVITLGASGCVTGVPHCCAIVVPARYDVGATVAADRPAPGVHVGVGASWASFAANPATPIDVAFGYVIEVRGSEVGGVDRRAAPGHDRLGDTTFGGYLELAGRVAATRHQRSFVGLRAELVQNDPGGESRWGAGITARAAWELLRAGQGDRWRGALAVGVFVEATTRRYADDLREHMVVTGLSFRVPAFFARTR